MKQLKVFGVFALAFAIFASPALAETQTVKVSGSLDVYWFYRDNYDLRDGNEQSVVPLTGLTPVRTTTQTAASSQTQDDAADWFMSIAQVEIAADLTDNVSVVLNLFNQRDWNANTYELQGQVVPVGLPGAGGFFPRNTADEFDIGVDLAYVTLEEAWYEPLTLTIGRQDIEFGRGFIFGNFQIQDPELSIIANEYSAVTSYDAVRATLDFEPWTVDFVAANIAETAPNAEDDRTFWWANVNYQFSDYNAEWEAYIGLDADKNTNVGTAAALVRSNSPEKTYVVGTRAEFDPVENLTLGGEFAYQWGDFFGGTSPTINVEADREAFALDLYGQYVWYDNAYTPWIGLEYVFFSGDEIDTNGATGGTFEGWNGLFRSPTYGVIREYLDVIYQTALTTDSGTVGPTAATNHQHFSIAGGLSPMEDLSIDATFYWFWTDENYLASAGVPAIATQDLGNEVGTELDVNVTYNYTEDVTFNLGLAWFWPGEIYDSYNVRTTLSPGGEQVSNGPVNDTATEVRSSVSVVF